jgi:DUF971 family protein
MKLRLEKQELYVQWRDGSETVYPAAYLRQNCPCATCRTEREEKQTISQLKLNVISGQDLRMTGAELVGRYAIKLIWSDGHSTGIFDFKYLHALR